MKGSVAMNLNEKLNLLIKEKGITRAELARQTGIPYTTIDGILKRNSFEKVKLNYIEALKKYFNVSLDYLIDNTIIDRNYGKKNVINTIPVGTIHMIRVIGRVAAGNGCLAQYDPLGYEMATDIKNPEEYVYLRVSGDSMHPNIMDGDLALVHMQPDVESGELAVVVVNGEEGVIKKVVKHEGAVSLVSFNPEYPPRLIMGHELNEFYIFGKVVETKRKY